MQFFKLQLLSFCVILSGISINRAQLSAAELTAESLKMLHGGCQVLYFFENGIAEGVCRYSGRKKPYITVNGMNVTNEVITHNFSSEIGFAIPLNRKTVMGDYLCHSDEVYPLHRIRYILCDPSELVPAKVCPKGQFCVINGSGTSCQERIDCDRHNSGATQCKSGRLSNPTKDSCHVYNIAQEVPNYFYLEDNLYAKPPCTDDPRVMHNGNVVKYRSTISISSSNELERHTWNTVGNLSLDSGDCKMKEQNYSMKFNQSDFSAVWDGNLPSKVSVCCRAEGKVWSASAGSTRFYMIFYSKNRVRFSIAQKSASLTIDITNNTNKELLLDPTTPFNCTISIHGGLFIEAFSMKANPVQQPKLGKDSVEMKYNGDRNATYTCVAKVYYYEYFGGTRFKPLYTEKRVIRVYYSAISTKSSSAVLVGMCVGIALGAAILLVIVVFGVRAYRKKAKRSKEKQDAIPFHLRPVKAPESDRFKSMTADASAALVSASHRQTSGVSGIDHLIYKRKPKSRMSTGSVGTGSSHVRRSGQGIPERAMFTRRGTGTVESKAKSGTRTGSLGTGSSHMRRFSQGIGAGEPRATRRGTKTEESKDESTSAI